VSKAEAESIASLVLVHEEANESARNIALREDELANARHAWDMIEVNLQGLSDKVADINLWWEDVER
jgi:hypothetical protein